MVVKSIWFFIMVKRSWFDGIEKNTFVLQWRGYKSNGKKKPWLYGDEVNPIVMYGCEKGIILWHSGHDCISVKRNWLCGVKRKWYGSQCGVHGCHGAPPAMMWENNVQRHKLFHPSSHHLV